MHTEDFSIAIQAGGKSSRMGQEKGLLKFRDQPLIEYILGQLSGFGSETFIVSNQPHHYQAFGCSVYTDVFPETGPLGGLYSAIYHAKNDICLVLACDMPIINHDLLNFLFHELGEFDAVIPRLKSNDYAEPFRAVYRKSCLDPIFLSLKRGEHRVISFFDYAKINFINNEEIIKYDPHFHSFTNINTTEDLKAAERLAIVFESSGDDS